jgi:hypothetical protein
VNLMMTNAAIWLNKINKRIEVNREINWWYKVLCNKLVLNFCKYNIVTWKLYDIKVVKTLWVAATLQTLT